MITDHTGGCGEEGNDPMEVDKLNEMYHRHKASHCDSRF